jgi:hypothetical protein
MNYRSAFDSVEGHATCGQSLPGLTGRSKNVRRFFELSFEGLVNSMFPDWIWSANEQKRHGHVLSMRLLHPARNRPFDFMI